MALILAIFVLFWNIKICRKNSICSDNFSASQTTYMKGLFAIYVILHHLCTYLADECPSFLAFKYLGFLMVGGFFLLSGYGLTYGVLNKENYMKGFLKKRLLSILVPYYLICLLNIFTNRLSGGLSLKYILLLISCLNMWFVAAIVFLYIMFFVCFKCFSQKNALRLMTAANLGYIIGMFAIHKIFTKYGIYTKYGLPVFGFWWYNSAICFSLGMWYCRYKDKIDSLLNKRYVLSLLLSFIVLAVSYIMAVPHFNDSLTYVLIAEIFACIGFCTLLIALSYRVKIGNKLLGLCGKLSLELYLCHACFIYLFRCGITFFGVRIYIDSNLLYFAAIMISSILFSYVVNIISSKILLIPKSIKSKKDTSVSLIAK